MVYNINPGSNDFVSCIIKDMIYSVTTSNIGNSIIRINRRVSITPVGFILLVCIDPYAPFMDLTTSFFKSMFHLKDSYLNIIPKIAITIGIMNPKNIKTP